MLEHMDALVEACLDDMKKNVSPDEKQALRLQMRWQQRGIMRDSLLAHIEEVIATKNEMLERAKETDEHANDYAPTYY